MIDKRSFLVNYIMSLKERTRNEKDKTAIGFDWIIYNLFLIKGYTPIELPFLRDNDHTKFKTKVSPQFGVDMAFVKDHNLIVLILKDEHLTYSNWINHGFDSDLKRAASPDPDVIQKEKIKSQRVILAYNKDEDTAGVEQYNRVIFSLKKSSLKKTTFEKWNLTKIVEEVENYLLTPELLPQHLTAQLSFICQLVKTTEFGSQQWDQLLLPNWKHYLARLLDKKIETTDLRIVAISLVIIDSFRDKSNPNSYLGFIELIEWAVLSSFNRAEEMLAEEHKVLYFEIWANLYLKELFYFLEFNQKLFVTEHGLSRSTHLWSLAPLNDAYLVYWYIAKIAICFLGYSEMSAQNDEDRTRLKDILMACRVWLRNLINLNSGAYRPLVDLDHIQIYLIWIVLNEKNDQEFIINFFSELEVNLLIRKLGKVDLPFIEAGNRYELVAEYLVTPKQKKNIMEDFIDNGSYLMLMILELIQSIDDEKGLSLLKSYWLEIVLGKHTDGMSMGDDINTLTLQSIEPDENWAIKVFSEGNEIVRAVYFPLNNEIAPARIQESLLSFITKCTTEFPNTLELQYPLGTYILACLKHKYPLPPYFWRKLIFPELYKAKESEKE